MLKFLFEFRLSARSSQNTDSVAFLGMLIYFVAQDEELRLYRAVFLVLNLPQDKRALHFADDAMCHLLNVAISRRA